MPSVAANGLTLEYDTFGDSAAPALLLIMGLGAQMTRWHPEFCQQLAARDHYVIRFDNRDVGLSTHLDEAGVPEMAALVAAMMQGETPQAPYTLSAMAADAVGLLDALEVDAAHLCGASLGGMIAQTFAIEHPTRTCSLTSIMSTTGNRSLPPATPEAQGALLSPPATDAEAAAERALAVAAVIGSPGFALDPEETRARARADFERSVNPAGVARQMAAAATQPDRREALAQLACPALVIHGREDPLVPLAGGLDTHEALSNSTLCVIDGMGHDLPRGAWPQVVDAISTLTSSAR